MKGNSSKSTLANFGKQHVLRAKTMFFVLIHRFGLVLIKVNYMFLVDLFKLFSCWYFMESCFLKSC